MTMRMASKKAYGEMEGRIGVMEKMEEVIRW